MPPLGKINDSMLVRIVRGPTLRTFTCDTGLIRGLYSSLAHMTPEWRRIAVEFRDLVTHVLLRWLNGEPILPPEEYGDLKGGIACLGFSVRNSDCWMIPNIQSSP